MKPWLEALAAGWDPPSAAIDALDSYSSLEEAWRAATGEGLVWLAARLAVDSERGAVLSITAEGVARILRTVEPGESGLTAAVVASLDKSLAELERLRERAQQVRAVGEANAALLDARTLIGLIDKGPPVAQLEARLGVEKAADIARRGQTAAKAAFAAALVRAHRAAQSALGSYCAQVDAPRTRIDVDDLLRDRLAIRDGQLVRR